MSSTSSRPSHCYDMHGIERARYCDDMELRDREYDIRYERYRRSKHNVCRCPIVRVTDILMSDLMLRGPRPERLGSDLFKIGVSLVCAKLHPCEERKRGYRRRTDRYEEEYLEADEYFEERNYPQEDEDEYFDQRNYPNGDECFYEEGLEDPRTPSEGQKTSSERTYESSSHFTNDDAKEKIYRTASSTTRSSKSTRSESANFRSSHSQGSRHESRTP